MRPSAAQLAHDLQVLGHSGTASHPSSLSGGGVGGGGSPRFHESLSDGLQYDDYEPMVESLTEQLRQLEQRVEQLNNTQQQSDSRHTRLREENQLLIDRIHGLEGQLSEVENSRGSELELERRQIKDFLVSSDDTTDGRVGRE